MSDTLDYLKTFALFPFGLRRFLQHRLTIEQARAVVLERMSQREQNFLRIAERGIYGYPRSPYLAFCPRIKLDDEQQVLDVVLNALRESSPMADAARTLWQQAQTIQVRRQEPVWTSGKLQPLHIQRRQSK